MVQITRGSNTTLKSKSLEGRLFEACYVLKNQLGNNDDVEITFDIDFDNKTATVNYELPARHIVNSEGATVVTGIKVLSDFEFFPGDGGQFVSDSIVGQIVEMLMYGQNLEILQTRGTNAENKITANYDSDNQKVTGSITIDIGIKIIDSDGGIEFIAKEFLS